MAYRQRERGGVEAGADLRPEQLAFLLWHLVYQRSDDDPRRATQYLLESNVGGTDNMALVPAGVERYLSVYRSRGASGIRRDSAQIGEMLAQQMQSGLACRIAEAEVSIGIIMAVDTTDLVSRVARLGENIDSLVALIDREHPVTEARPVKGKSCGVVRDTKTKVNPLSVGEIAAYLGVDRRQITVQNILGGRRPGVLEVGCISCVPVQAVPVTEFGPDPEILAEQRRQEQEREEAERSARWLRTLGIIGTVGGVFMGVAQSVMAAPLMLVDPLLLRIDERKIGRLSVGAGPLIGLFNDLSRVSVGTAVDLLSFAEMATAFEAALKNRPVGVQEQWGRTQRARVQLGLTTLTDIATVMRQGFDRLMEYQWSLWHQLELQREATGVVPASYGLLLPEEAAVLGSMIKAMYTGLEGTDQRVKVAGDDRALIERMRAGVI